MPCACSVLFPNIDDIFGILGGTTAVVISFVGPSLFWDCTVGYMYKWSHPRKIMSRSAPMHFTWEHNRVGGEGGAKERRVGCWVDALMGGWLVGKEVG